jgi:Trypsin-co-occurring domain 1
MSDLVRIPLDGGGSVLVERADGDVRGPVRAGQRGNVVVEATETMRQALEPIRRGARAVLDGLRETAPDEIKVEFGVTLTAETGAIIAKASSDCHLTVTLTWKGEEHPSE